MSASIPPEYQRCGFGNGTIPDCALVSLTGFGPSVYRLNPEAASQLIKMRVAARTAGFPFTLTSAYRNYANQQDVKRKYKRLAADPGDSNHGWGTAVDIKELSSDAVSSARAALAQQGYTPDDNGDARLNKYIRENNPLYKWLDENAPKYGWENPIGLRNGSGLEEAWHFEYVGFGKDLGAFREGNPARFAIDEACADSPPNPGSSTGGSDDYSLPLGAGNYVIGQGISPYITTTDSLHPNIQLELTRRRVASETANVYMPFVKLTSLTYVKGENVQNGPPNTFPAYCPTLGVHGEQSVDFDDIYNPQSNNSVVGYATQFVENGTPTRVKLVVENGQETDQPNIPPPGIVSMNLERSTAGPMGVRGGLLRGNLRLVAYSVGQLNVLLRYFLRPGTRVVLEVGRKSSSTTENLLETELAGSQDYFKTFNWARPLNGENSILGELEPLVTLQTTDGSPKDRPQRKFVRKYTYNNFGNYEIFVGYVVTFKLKYTKNNTYEIDLTIHSVQQFEVPVKITGAKSICANAITNPCKVLDIQDYFSRESTYKGNSFENLLAKSIDENDTDIGQQWNTHVVQLKSRGAESDADGTKTTGYLVSWRFLVDVVFHNETFGMMSIFKEPNSNQEALSYIKTALPPIQTEPPIEPDAYGLYSTEVGWHKNLRSTNPGVMLIINDAAQKEAKYNADRNFYKRNLLLLAERDAGDTATYGKDAAGNDITDETLNEGSVDNDIVQASYKGAVGPFEKRGALPIATLLHGVMINSNAIKDAFTSTDTFANGLAKLLTMMNGAVEGFWNLQLLSNDESNPGVHVVDMALSKPVDRELIPSDIDTILNITDSTSLFQNLNDLKADVNDPDSARYLYKFNRKLKSDVADDIGGELLDINLEAALPQVVAIQAIAGVGGIASRGVLESIDVKELKDLSLFPKLYANCAQDSDLCGDNADSPCPPIASEYANEQVSAEELVNLEKLFRLETTSLETLQQERDRLINKYKNLPGTSTNNRIEAGSAIGRLYKRLTEESQQRNGGLGTLITQYGNMFGKAIQYIEYDKATMVKKLDEDRNAPERGGIHPFNSSNLTKTTVDLTLPGIGGISLFQAFAVDRVPNILDSGYYVVTKIAHDFSVQNGWITKIQGRFRAKPRKTNTNVDTNNPCAST